MAFVFNILCPVLNSALTEKEDTFISLCNVVIKKDYFRNTGHKTAEERLYVLCIMVHRKDRWNALPLSWIKMQVYKT